MKTLLEATILVQAGLGIAALPAGMEGKLAREVSVFAIEGDSFRIRTVALRRRGPGNQAAQHFFQVIRQDLEGRSIRHKFYLCGPSVFGVSQVLADVV